MNIGLIAHDSKKELMVQFCIAYCGYSAATVYGCNRNNWKIGGRGNGIWVS